MNEHQWLASREFPRPLLDVLLGEASRRKKLLFASACLRRLWPLLLHGGAREAVTLLEREADGAAPACERGEAIRLAEAAAAAARADQRAIPWPPSPSTATAYASCSAAFAVEAALLCPNPARTAAYAFDAVNNQSGNFPGWAELRWQADLLRDLFGPPPFRPVTIPQVILAWNDGVVVKLAAAAYEERATPEGTLDPHRLSVLADALEEAGCDDADILGHLRQQGAVHVRGCWCVDLLLERG